MTGEVVVGFQRPNLLPERKLASTIVSRAVSVDKAKARPTTSIYRPPPFIYGQILARSLYLSESVKQEDPPRFLRIVCQGMAGGVLITFLAMLLFAYDVNLYYAYLVLPFLPEALAYGLVIGLFSGLTCWLSTKLVGRPLWLLSRLILGVLSYISFLYIQAFMFPPEERAIGAPTLTTLLIYFLFPGLLIGSITGSRFQIERNLVRGIDQIGIFSKITAGLTGLTVRLAVIFLFMASTILLILIIRSEGKELGLGLASVGSFAAALVLVFSRPSFNVLGVLAFIVNIPSTYLLFQITQADSLLFTCGYLVAWSLFLLARSPLVLSFFALLNKEIKYYLID